MDGFHLDNQLLKKRGLLNRKGAPETFDVDGFCNCVERISCGSNTVFCPSFDREQDLSVAGAIEVSTDHVVIVFEGNYLLLKDAPWSGATGRYHLTAYLHMDLTLLEERLVNRWISHGLQREEAERRALENDLVNAKVVQDHSVPAKHHIINS